MSSINSLQRQHWHRATLRKRRTANHPVVAAFVAEKLDVMESILSCDNSDLSALSVLDVGSGNGHFSAHIGRRARFICAADFSSVMLAANPATHKVCADAAGLPFADDAFDVVFCSNLLHHLDAPMHAVNEMARVAKRYMIILEPNRNNPLNLTFGLVVKAERNSIRFNSMYIRNLVANIRAKSTAIVGERTSGCILPNRFPRWTLRFLPAIDLMLWPKLDCMCVVRLSPVAS